MGLRRIHPLIWIICLLLQTAYAQEPASDWKTAESKHFKVNFRPANRAQAHQALSIAERVHVYVTQELNWQPREKTELVLINSVDFANGYATPFPFNRSGIYLTAPNSGELLNRDDWLETVILHEYVHIVHLDKVRGFPKALRFALGRVFFAFPNIFQPTWVIEGLATYYESVPGDGIGRLQNTIFEAQMRDELQHGFMSLREINAGGRKAPLNRAYLYGSYFFDFMKRRYGEQSIYRYINDYSNNIVPFRLHTSPRGATGKTMDVLWQEFLQDLEQQINQRSAAILKQPAILGDPLDTRAYRNIPSLHSAKNGDIYAVLENAITRPQLVRYSANGNPKRLHKVRRGSFIDVREDNTVLISQPEVCANVHLYFDLYRFQNGSLKRLTRCGRYLRATWSRDSQGNNAIIAIRNRVDHQQIVLMDENANNEQILLEGKTTIRWIDIDSSADGQRIALIGLRDGEFGIYELNRGDTQPTLLLKNRATKHSIRFSSDNNSLYYITDQSGAANVWRYRINTQQTQRVTHAHTAITTLAGDDAEGQLSMATLTKGQYQLYRLSSPTAIDDQDQTPLVTTGDTHLPIRESLPAVPAIDINLSQQLPGERDYNPFRSLRPRSWIPLAYADADTYGIGVSLNGADALNHHHYTLQPIFEFSQNELLGLAAYNYRGYLQHGFAVSRTMNVTKTIEVDDLDEAIEYETNTNAQWTSAVPLLRVDSQWLGGLGAAISQERLHQIDGDSQTLEDEKVAAVFINYSSASANLLSEGYSQGIRIRALHESYDVFDTEYDGTVTRYDINGYLPIGSTVVAMRVTEARAKKRTEPFQLGGAYVEFAGTAPVLNSRRLPLRGYNSDQPQLEGANARLATLEWRAPIIDIDRHAMVPPIGINRLSASVFYESGSTWGIDDPIADFDKYRAYGVEIRSEIILGYSLYLPLRIGVAHGIDEFGDTEAYAAIGLNF